jgi:hypothetical protein
METTKLRLEGQFAAETNPAKRGRIAKELRELRTPAAPANIRHAGQAQRPRTRAANSPVAALIVRQTPAPRLFTHGRKRKKFT